MAERFSIRGHREMFDWVCEIVHTKDDKEEIIGIINTATGQYTPPELLDTMKSYENSMIGGVQITLNKAKIPMNPADFVTHGLEIER